MTPEIVTFCRLEGPRCSRFPPQSHCLVSFFFQEIVLFLEDGFQSLAGELATMLHGEGIGVVNDFSVGGVSGGGPEFTDERLRLFEQKGVGFGFYLFSGLVVFRHGESFRVRGK